MVFPHGEKLQLLGEQIGRRVAAAGQSGGITEKIYLGKKKSLDRVAFIL